MKTTFKNRLTELSKEQLIDYIGLLVDNLWTLQNNWIMNVERKYGEDVAMELDELCMGRLMEVETYRLKRFFGLDDDIESLARTIDYSAIWAYVDFDYPEKNDDKLRLRVTRCTMQLQRRKAGRDEIGCKKAGVGPNARAAKIINPKINTVLLHAPPDPHSDDNWCEFEYTFDRADKVE